MGKYLAYLEQDGGCDYTIGCGVSKITINASNIEEAKNKIEEILEKNWLDLVNRCTLYEISDECKIDIDEIYSRVEKRKQEVESYEPVKYDESEKINVNRILFKITDLDFIDDSNLNWESYYKKYKLFMLVVSRHLREDKQNIYEVAIMNNDDGFDDEIVINEKANYKWIKKFDDLFK